MFICLYVYLSVIYHTKLLYVCTIYPLCIYLYLYRCRQLITYSECCIVATEFNFVLMGRTFDRATNSRLSTTPITPYPFTPCHSVCLCWTVTHSKLSLLLLFVSFIYRAIVYATCEKFVVFIRRGPIEFSYLCSLWSLVCLLTFALHTAGVCTSACVSASVWVCVSVCVWVKGAYSVV